MKAETIDEIKSYVRLIGCALLFIYFMSNYIVTCYRIEGRSMYPLLENSQRVIANRLAYKASPVKRGDVVVFTAPSDPEKTFIKRIIGLPGDLIRIDNGDIYVGREKIDDSFVPDEFRSSETTPPTRVPMGFYFVAGDNRVISDDSRVWLQQKGSFPFVPERYIQGKVAFRIWPISQTGFIPSIDLEQMVTS